MTEIANEVDVLIVGCGPVGQTLALMLGRQGHRVLAVDRWPIAYPSPRAVHFDDEIARVLSACGLGSDLPAITEPAGEYDWHNAEGRTLLHFDWGKDGPSGWPTANMFHQPQLEALLATHAGRVPTVGLHRGWEAVDLDSGDDHVVVHLRSAEGQQRQVHSRYVVGCDGANSFVRGRMSTDVEDLGFFYDWLILDVVPHENREWRPINLQICDPLRPTTVVSSGPGRRRWEFMRLPGEDLDLLNSEDTAWRLLAPWGLNPENATLERHTVYTFQARWARRWREGRLLLAGDAAHLMPPFAGQGMCSGIRDAANLSWKLDLVLTGRAEDGLLDTYTTERTVHVRNAIGMSVELGNVICIADHGVAAERDGALLAAGGRPEVALPPIPPPVLGPGVLLADQAGDRVGAAGQLSPQGRVTTADGRSGLFDDVVGTGFALLSFRDSTTVLHESELRALAGVGGRVVRLTDGRPDAGGAVRPGPTPPISSTRDGEVVVADVEGTYAAWMQTIGAAAVLVRPDFYVFGSVPDAAGAAALADSLLKSIEPSRRSALSGTTAATTS